VPTEGVEIKGEFHPELVPELPKGEKSEHHSIFRKKMSDIADTSVFKRGENLSPRES